MTDNQPQSKNIPWTSGRKRADGNIDKRQPTDNQPQSNNTPWTSDRKRADGNTGQKTTDLQSATEQERTVDIGQEKG